MRYVLSKPPRNAPAVRTGGRAGPAHQVKNRNDSHVLHKVPGVIHISDVVVCNFCLLFIKFYLNV